MAKIFKSVESKSSNVNSSINQFLSLCHQFECVFQPPGGRGRRGQRREPQRPLRGAPGVQLPRGRVPAPGAALAGLAAREPGERVSGPDPRLLRSFRLKEPVPSKEPVREQTRFDLPLNPNSLFKSTRQHLTIASDL